MHRSLSIYQDFDVLMHHRCIVWIAKKTYRILFNGKGCQPFMFWVFFRFRLTTILSIYNLFYRSDKIHGNNTFGYYDRFMINFRIHCRSSVIMIPSS